MGSPPHTATDLVVRTLEEHRFALAHPLARTALPELSLEEWCAFLADHLRQAESGLSTVENGRGTMLALAAFCVRPDLQHGRCLLADPVIVMDLVGAGLVARLIDEHLQREARRLGCAALRLQLPMARGLAAEERGLTAFRCCGLATDALRLSKAVALLSPAF